MATHIGRVEIARAASDVLSIAGGALVAWTFSQRSWLVCAAIFIVATAVVGMLRAYKP